jgi:hypothetical protein
MTLRTLAEMACSKSRRSRLEMIALFRSSKSLRRSFPQGGPTGAPPGWVEADEFI